jgi:hypothetical protein
LQTQKFGADSFLMLLTLPLKECPRKLLFVRLTKTARRAPTSTKNTLSPGLATERYRGDHVEAEVVDSSPPSKRAPSFRIYCMSMDGPINVARLLHLCSPSVAPVELRQTTGDPLHGFPRTTRPFLGAKTFLETKVEFLRTTRSFLGVYPVGEEGPQEGNKPVNGGLLV